MRTRLYGILIFVWLLLMSQVWAYWDMNTAGLCALLTLLSFAVGAALERTN